MELISVKAKFDMTVKSIIKESLNFENLTNEESIDTLLDKYIDDKNNIEKIHESIEESLSSNWNIDEIVFIENETEINLMNEENLEAKTNLTVLVEDFFSKSTSNELIENLIDEISFKSNNRLIAIDAFDFVKYE